MRALGFAIVTVLLWLGVIAPAAAQAPDPYSKGPHIALKLIAESDTPAPGKTVTLAYDATPQPGWHGYWQNPGDAGFPAKLDWTLPAGVTAEAPRYPVPTTLLIAGLMNYVFEQHFTLLITLNVPASATPGTRLPIKLKTQYLVCTEEICQPEAGELSLDLTVGDGAIAPERLAQFDRYRQAIPKPIGMAATYQIDGKGLRIGIPYPASAPLDQAYFFPTTADRLNYAAPQKVVRDGDRLVISTELLKPGAGPIDGILRIGPQKAVSLSATAGAVPSASGGSGQSAGAQNGVLVATLIALGGAILGGLILNIMPCVFPILSLKALSLAKGSVDEREARRE
ncbi:MAG: thiol:disulfide interchange protein, partial [Sphingomonas sp.]|nr:thiol:disulfide interchange protein [Sphingomonas sp.]